MQLEEILAEAVKLKASDIHLTAGQKVFIRTAGELVQFGEILSETDLKFFYIKCTFFFLRPKDGWLLSLVRVLRY